jgi:RNA polymerase sigma factor (sigma-70 family)
MTTDIPSPRGPEPPLPPEPPLSVGGLELPNDADHPDTPDLVRRAQAGDADALNELFARHHTLMVEVARRRIGPKLRLKEDPDDLAQTTFREATRDFKNYEYRGEGSLVRWLIQILQNKIRDKAEFYSAGKRDAAMEIALGIPVDPQRDFAPRGEPQAMDLSVTRQVQRDERFEILRQALLDLSPEYRQAITLVFFQGMSLREAGERLGGRTEDALRMLLRRAEGRLGDILRRALGEDLDDASRM